MGFGHRVFFIEEDERVVRIPTARFTRIYDGIEALPAYAGQRVRCADVMIQLEDRRFTGWYREWYYFLPFDDSGRVDRDEVLRGAALAMDAHPLLPGEREADGGRSNVVDLRSRFAKVRLEHEVRWQPGHRLRKQLLDLALGRRPSGR